MELPAYRSSNGPTSASTRCRKLMLAPFAVPTSVGVTPRKLETMRPKAFTCARPAGAVGLRLVIGRLIHHYHLEVGVVLSEEVRQGVAQHAFAPIGGHDDADGWDRASQVGGPKRNHGSGRETTF